MHRLRFVAVGFGSVGVVITLLLVVAIWIAASRIVKTADRLTDSADRGVLRASELLDRVNERTNQIDVNVGVVVDGLLDSERAPLRPEGARAPQLIQIAVVEAAARELGAWTSWTDQAADLLFDVSKTMRDLPFSSAGSLETVDGLASRLDLLSDRLGDLERETDSLHAILAEIDPAVELPRQLRDSVTQLAGRVSDRLDSVQDQVQATQTRLKECRSGLRELRQSARAWIRGIAALLTFVMVWLGLGQVSLLYVGWTASRKRKG